MNTNQIVTDAYFAHLRATLTPTQFARFIEKYSMHVDLIANAILAFNNARKIVPPYLDPYEQFYALRPFVAAKFA